MQRRHSFRQFRRFHDEPDDTGVSTISELRCVSAEKSREVTTSGPYRWMRHPLYVGWFFAFWMTPTMTLAHLVFAIGTTVYILVAILGFIYGDGDSIFNLIPVNTEDNVLHVLIGVAGLGAGFATPAEPAPTTAATAG